MPELPPLVWAAIIVSMTAYVTALEVWHALVALWHKLPALGHGLLHIITGGLK